jgi:UDP-4-amino-4,6-dideoxy-N-acetyl-beta-L-altrosamine transaminase
VKPIPYGRQTITDGDVAAVVEALRSDFLTQGPLVPQFEEAFRSLVHSSHAVAVSNATAGLHIACLALGVGPGSRVIVPPMTFAASANCVRYCGGSVEFVDIDPDTRCLSPERTAETIERAAPGTYAGIVAVDYAGHPADLEALHAIARAHGLWIIEDACHAPGGGILAADGTFRWRCGDGRLADVASFSFHPVKHLTTGEGGMMTTCSQDVAKKMQRLRTHGISKDPSELSSVDGPWSYEMQELGYNYRLTEIQAALGISQLRRFDEDFKRRQEIAAVYDRELAGLPIVLPRRGRNVVHAFHLYVIESDQRRQLFDHLRSASIYPQVHYIPVNSMPYYRALGHKATDTPVSLRLYERAMSLPMFGGLTDDDLARVVDAVRAFYR